MQPREEWWVVGCDGVLPIVQQGVADRNERDRSLLAGRRDVSHAIQKRRDLGLLRFELLGQKEIVGGRGGVFGGRNGDYGSLSSLYSFGMATRDLDGYCINYELKRCTQFLNST